ncbi:tyrosine--tRNA ligase [Candidatus Liberibacter sp.]|uniref:tyrosine--tRNA ligase n=1 Tax=Candidatus Liberibacter sp. TaxID=34022 RepID=UPI0015F4E8FD|nr:tyrosine--tRNA ligase [Candidatus Liberibacter sp.]MBA5724310.1 tyrosine--tRNA ligase [Candidatus Liberibacter sp.]
MSDFMSDFLNILSRRGFIHQASDSSKLDNLFCTTTVTAYIGYDPTACSLHVGHLTQLMMLYWLQKTGHRPISLMGGATGIIGDPSFRSEVRQLLTTEKVNENISAIQGVFSRFLRYGDGKTDALMVNNADWLTSLEYICFLRDIGCHFSLKRMLSFESVKSRLNSEQSLSFLEFNYMILQAYDFVELAKRYGCYLQMGGSDQWGNMINGVELGHRLRTPYLFALTSPLLTTSSGTKMGKTASGAVWLNADMTSVYDFWQYWRNVEDASVIRFLKILTTLPMAEIEKLSQLKGAEISEAKKILATEITSRVHGRYAAEKAASGAAEVFEKGIISQEMPTFLIPKNEFDKSIGLLKLIVKAKFASSNSEARRHIRSGAIKINNQAVSDEEMQLESRDCDSNGNIKLSFGKKHHVIFSISSYS